MFTLLKSWMFGSGQGNWSRWFIQCQKTFPRKKSMELQLKSEGRLSQFLITWQKEVPEFRQKTKQTFPQWLIQV